MFNSMDYKIVSNDDCKGDWEETASQFKDYNIYQTFSYQKIRCKESRGILTRVEIYDSKENLVSAFLMRVMRMPLIGAYFGYVQRGPLVLHKGRGMVCSVEMFRELSIYLFSQGLSGLSLNFNVYNGTERQRIKAMLDASGYCFDTNISPYRTMLFSLVPEVEDLFKSLHRGWRRNIKKAKKADLLVQQDYTATNFSALELLYKQAKKRKKFQGVDLNVFLKAQNSLSQKEKMLVTSVYVNNEPGTILVTGMVGDIADDILVATSETGYRYSTAYYAYWNAFLTCREKGVVKYDLGGIDPDNNPAVFQFKAGTGAEDVTIIGKYDIYKNTRVKLFWKAAVKMRDFVT